jgi:hypothetical protein
MQAQLNRIENCCQPGERLSSSGVLWHNDKDKSNSLERTREGWGEKDSTLAKRV